MKAYITLLSNSKYLPGVLVLYRSLKDVGAQYPLFCLLSVSVEKRTEQKLVDEGIRCLRLTRTAINCEVNPSGKNFSHWNYTFDKLLIWGLTQFEKVVYIDSDMLIVRNIDSLFEHKSFSAVSADASYPGNESWVGGLNSGIVVIKPDKGVEADLLQSIRPTVEKYKKQGQLVGDQDVVKSYLSDWGHQTFLHLDEGYNIFADHLTYYIRHLGYSLKSDAQKPIYVIHFIGKTKPWGKKTIREYIWLIRMCLKNPYYVIAYNRFMKYLK